MASRAQLKRKLKKWQRKETRMQVKITRLIKQKNATEKVVNKIGNVVDELKRKLQVYGKGSKS